MKFIFSLAIALLVFFTTVTTPFLQFQEPLSENWKIEGPIVEQIYPSTQSRGVFIDQSGLVLHKRGTYPADTLQLQLDSSYTDLYVELQDGSGTLAMVMGEKRPPGVKHMPISSVIYVKVGAFRSTKAPLKYVTTCSPRCRRRGRRPLLQRYVVFFALPHQLAS